MAENRGKVVREVVARRAVVALAGMVVLLMLPVSCAKKVAAPSAPGPGGGPMAPEAAAPARSADTAAEPSPAGGEGKSQASILGGRAEAAEAAIQKKIVYTADYVVEVKDAQAVGKQVEAIAARAGGFLSGSTHHLTDAGRHEVTVTVRIPTDHFTEVVNEVQALGKVLKGQVNSEDVTRQYVDLDARLRNKQREETRLADLMNRAGRLSDVITVEEKLSSVQEEVERLQGELNYLKEQVALSTLTVSLFEEKPPELGKLGPFYVGSYVQTAVTALVKLVRALVVVVIFVVIVGLPVWVILAVAFAVHRARRARKASPGP